MSDIQSISILGCGWYGFPLAVYLIEQGYELKGSTTSTTKFTEFETAGIRPFKVNFEAETESYDPAFFKCHLLIISVPPKRSSGETGTYAKKIEKIKTAIIKSNIKRVILISSTSVYGDHNQHVDEDTIPQPDTESGKAMLEAENILKDQSEFKLTVLRFGGLIGPGRDPARFFAGKKNIPNGKAPVNMLHLDDCIGVTHAVIQKDAFGYVFNACAASHPEKMDFYSRAAANSKMEMPEFIPELKEWKIVSTDKAERILGYRFNEI